MMMNECNCRDLLHMGIIHVVNATDGDVLQQIQRITQQDMPAIVIDASGNLNAKAKRRSHQLLSGTSQTLAPSCAWIIEVRLVAMPACLAGKCDFQRNSNTSPS